MPPLEVFLSHSSVDHEMATKIAGVLNAHGVPAFFSRQNIVGAQQWQNEILSALKRCDWFLVLLSPDAVSSMWVNRETSFALGEQRYENKIIPLKYRDCDLGPLEWLKLFQMVDFRGEFNDGCRELLKIWAIGLKA